MRYNSMNRIIFALLGLLLYSMPIIAQNEPQSIIAKQLFIEVPDSLFPSIDKNTRLDMIDYYECGYNRPSLDVFKDSCKISHIDDENIIIETSPILKQQISVLSNNIILLISTHSIPTHDSEIEFYDFNWNKLESNQLFTSPKLYDWLSKEGKKEQQDIENYIPFLITEYQYNSNDKTLTLINNLQDYFTDSDWNKIAPLLLTQLKYKWAGGKFKKK